MIIVSGKHFIIAILMRIEYRYDSYFPLWIISEVSVLFSDRGLYTHMKKYTSWFKEMYPREIDFELINHPDFELKFVVYQI